jgi:hypothetical protein
MRKSHSKRRGQRGAVLVESLIVAGLLALFFAAGVFLNRLFEEKLASRRLAIAYAWYNAEQGCGEPAGGKLNDPGSLVTTPLPSVNSQFPDPTFLGTFTDAISSQSRQVAEPPIFGGATLTFSTSEEVLCADPKANNAGDPQNPLGAVTWAAAGARQSGGL